MTPGTERSGDGSTEGGGRSPERSESSRCNSCPPDQLLLMEMKSRISPLSKGSQSVRERGSATGPARTEPAGPEREERGVNPIVSAIFEVFHGGQGTPHHCHRGASLRRDSFAG